MKKKKPTRKRKRPVKVPLVGETVGQAFSRGTPPHEALPIRRVTATMHGADGQDHDIELVGTPKTIDVISELIAQVGVLQGLLDARGVEESEEREPWQPFVKCDAVVSPLDGISSIDDAAEVEGVEFWTNNHYTVTKYPLQPGLPVDEGGVGPMIHLSIRRADRKAVHDWRDFQRIKNELVGEEAEGIELYPAESRLVDGANQYHLFVFPEFHFPFGFDTRLVSESTEGGVTQRRWRDDERPSDLRVVTREEMQEAVAAMKREGKR